MKRTRHTSTEIGGQGFHFQGVIVGLLLDEWPRSAAETSSPWSLGLTTSHIHTHPHTHAHKLQPVDRMRWHSRYAGTLDDVSVSAHYSLSHGRSRVFGVHGRGEVECDYIAGTYYTPSRSMYSRYSAIMSYTQHQWDYVKIRIGREHCSGFSRRSESFPEMAPRTECGLPCCQRSHRPSLLCLGPVSASVGRSAAVETMPAPSRCCGGRRRPPLLPLAQSPASRSGRRRGYVIVSA